MSKKLIKKSQRLHYYEKDGTPAYGATVVRARKEGLSPSVTSIIGIIDKFQIGVWKQEQAIKATKDVLLKEIQTTDIADKEEHIKWFSETLMNGGFDKPITELLQEYLSKAATKGTRVHGYADSLLNEIPYEVLSGDEICWNPSEKWIKLHVVNVETTEKSFANTIIGFGGRIDFIGTLLIDDEEVKCVADFKTQNVKNGKVVYYDEWAYQLAAYRKYKSEQKQFISEEDGYKCVSVVISTNDDMPGIQVKIWDEFTAKKEISLEHGWNTFNQARKLFCCVKKLPERS